MNLVIKALGLDVFECVWDPNNSGHSEGSWESQSHRPSARAFVSEAAWAVLSLNTYCCGADHPSTTIL